MVFVVGPNCRTVLKKDPTFLQRAFSNKGNANRRNDCEKTG